MARPTVVLLSRRGPDSIDSESWTALRCCAQVRALRRDRAPDPVEAVELLAGADLLSSTNACLPTIDPILLDELPRLRGGRVLQTGHSAWWRDEVLERGARMWGERLLAAVRDQPLDAVTWPSRGIRTDRLPIGTVSA